MRTLLHHSITQNAETRPQGSAFRCRDNALNHKQLYESSAQLANTLVESGISSIDRVGIYMGRCIEMPIAVYGILMAAGAYVPIDPSAPPDRVKFILEDCGINILITNESKQSALSRILDSDSTPLKHIIGLSQGIIDSIRTVSWKTVWQAAKTPPAETAREDDLAYIMYTSGSTGVPKGLMHTHRSGLAYARHSADLYQVSSSDILGNHAPLHFDISTFEFLTGPYAGASSVLIPEEEIMFPVSLAEFIERERLTFWYSVPLALIQILLQADLSQVDLSSLRWVLFGGEPFPPKYLEKLIGLIPSARFCNVYGPAEVNQCTYFHLPEDFGDIGEPVPVGNIWEGARGIILSTEDQVITDNDEEVGELLIASATMMQGYWNRPDLNAKAFYYEEPAPGFRRRYYRTGDLFRRDKGGLLHFQGRKDRQIKLRGYRLELDEVEAAFTAQEHVLEAAAIVGEVDEEKQLIVFISLQQTDEFDAATSLEQARSRLPRYCIPQRLEVLSSFPRTTSGKIDHAKLKTHYASQPTDQSIQFP